MKVSRKIEISHMLLEGVKKKKNEINYWPPCTYH